MNVMPVPRLGTLPELAALQARELPNNVALSFEGRETTYAQLDAESGRIAAAYRARGIRKGDRVAYLGKNSDTYYKLLFGAARIGAVMAPINWRLAADEVGYIIGDSRAPILFVGPEFVELAKGAAAKLDYPVELVAIEDVGGAMPTVDEWLAANPGPVPDPDVEPGDVLVQLYTSGTTGHPKGAMLTHRNMLTRLADQADAGLGWTDWTSDDISLVAMPVFHIGGTGWGLCGLFSGAKCVVAREFDPNTVLDYIERDRISKLFMVPSALQIVVRQPRARQVDYSRLRHILYGASPIPLELLRECIEVFGCGFVQQYGMTETTGTIVTLNPEDHVPEGSPRMRGAGTAMPGIEVRIVDADMNPLPPGQVGEIVTRSPANMLGYWNLPEATAATITPDGWLRTGDAGYMDEDGYFYIQDRIKDMIISGGENVYPAEVEKAIYGHPAVAEVAVIGVPHAKWGETVKAVVVPKEGMTIDEQDIIDWCRQRIARFKVPTSVDAIDALPRNAAGKILKRTLREKYWAGHDRQVA